MDTEDRDHIDDWDDGDDGYRPYPIFRLPGDPVDLEAMGIPTWEALGQALDHAYRLSEPRDGASTPALDERGNPMTNPFHGTPAEVEALFLALNPGAREGGTVDKSFIKVTLGCERNVSKAQLNPFVVLSMDWAMKTFGPDIVSLVLHMDGKDPHIHIISNAAIERKESHHWRFPFPRTEYAWGESYCQELRLLELVRFDPDYAPGADFLPFENPLGGFNWSQHYGAILKLR
jgi:hypothetical protein